MPGVIFLAGAAQFNFRELVKSTGFWSVSFSLKRRSSCLPKLGPIRLRGVWVTTNRFTVLRGSMRGRIREILRQACRKSGVHIEMGLLSTDHVHFGTVTSDPVILLYLGLHSKRERTDASRQPFSVSVNPFEDLLNIGLELEAVSLTALDRTPFESLDGTNKFKAVGMRTLARAIKIARTLATAERQKQIVLIERRARLNKRRPGSGSPRRPKRVGSGPWHRIDDPDRRENADLFAETEGHLATDEGETEIMAEIVGIMVNRVRLDAMSAVLAGLVQFPGKSAALRYISCQVIAVHPQTTARTKRWFAGAQLDPGHNRPRCRNRARSLACRWIVVGRLFWMSQRPSPTSSIRQSDPCRTATMAALAGARQNWPRSAAFVDDPHSLAF